MAVFEGDALGEDEAGGGVELELAVVAEAVEAGGLSETFEGQGLGAEGGGGE
jgi:hypothetical protein